MIEKISGSPCSSTYRVEVGGYKTEVQLWAIIEGTLAITINHHYGYTVRCNYSKQHDSREFPNWLAWEQVAPRHFRYGNKEGDDAIYAYVLDTMPRVTTQEIRLAYMRELFGYEIKSQRFHDTGNQTYLRCKVNIQGSWSPVTAEAGCYWGRADEDMLVYANAEWKAAITYLNPAFDKKYCFKKGLLCDLTSEEFTKLLDVLLTLKK